MILKGSDEEHRDRVPEKQNLRCKFIGQTVGRTDATANQRESRSCLRL